MKRFLLFLTTLFYIASGFGQVSTIGIPIPTISAGGPTTIMSGGSVVLKANPRTGFSYQWLRDGVAISGATTSSYKATVSGDYTVSISLNSVSQISSSIVTVNTVFELPADNFHINVNDASCEGPANGAISITAAQSLNYRATITGNGLNSSYPFTDSTQINNLAAGTYKLCMEVAGEPDFQRCFAVVIDRPKDLLAYTEVTPSGDHVVVTLDGGNTYKLALNGILHMTSDRQITLPLAKGNNTITISTDKPCQGVLVKNVNVSPNILVYPNPFNSTINLSLGEDNLRSALINVISAEDGRPVYTNIYNNLAGNMQIDLSGLKTGLYLLRISGDNLEKVFKIQKR
jgi:large repetitive protein